MIWTKPDPIKVLGDSIIQVTIFEGENYMGLPAHFFNTSRSMIRAAMIIVKTYGREPRLERAIAEIAIGCTLAGFQDKVKGEKLE